MFRVFWTKVYINKFQMSCFDSSIFCTLTFKDVALGNGNILSSRAFWEPKSMLHYGKRKIPQNCKEYVFGIHRLLLYIFYKEKQ